MSAATALLARELRLALRSGGGAGLGLVFFLIVVLLMPFGVGPDRSGWRGRPRRRSGSRRCSRACSSLDRMFQADLEDGSLDILALAPLPLKAWSR